LSDGWFEALAAALDGLARSAEPTRGPTGDLALGQVITGVPGMLGNEGACDGEIRYTILLRQDGSAALIRSSTGSAHVTLIEDWSTAEAIMSGRSSVTDMLGAGRIKMRGDSRALVAAEALLTRAAPLLAAALAGPRAS
jgi:hypothetical protein